MPTNWAGKTIGNRYQIETLLGQGGMSAVYRATDPNLQRTVAIKLIHPHLSPNPDFINRFQIEATAIAQLRHPHIVQVYDFNQDGDTYYMVMEYLVGETLQEKIRRVNSAHRSLPYIEIIGLGTQLCDALGYAHSRGLIHRDVKPANIMLTGEGQAILTDFGIAKIRGGQVHTATGATLGTALYMSPEQMRGEGVDQRTDIYALGITLYEAISGRTPYQADSVPTLMMMVLTKPLPDLRAVRSDIPPTLVRAVEKAAAKALEERFQSMTEMADLLDKATIEVATMTSAATFVDMVPDPGEADEAHREPGAGQGQDTSPGHAPAAVPGPYPTTPDPVTSPPLPRVEKGLGERSAWTSRRFIASALILILLGTGVVAGTLYVRSPRQPAVHLTPITLPAEPINAQTAPFVVSLGRWHTDSAIAGVSWAAGGDLIGTAHNRQAAAFSTFRHYGALWLVGDGSLLRYQFGPTDYVNSAEFSPDGGLFALSSDDGSAPLWQVSDGILALTLRSEVDSITSIAFAPGNRLVATGSGGETVDLWDLRDGHNIRSLEGHGESIMDVTFSPDGTLLASASSDQTIRLWQVRDGATLHTLVGHSDAVRAVAFSPDGRLLASASNDRAIGLWQVSDGSLVRFLPEQEGFILDVVFSPDGSLLASACEDGSLVLWDVSSGDMIANPIQYEDSLTSLTFSPDGHLLVSAAWDGVIEFWGLSEVIPIPSDDLQTTPGE